MGLSRTREHPWLDRYAIFAAFCTFLLVIAGALVTSNGAGLSVPSWPTFFGSFHIPPMVGGIKYEAGHRIVAGFVGLLTVILALWIWARDCRPWLRRLGGIAVLALLAQAILGGIAVLVDLPVSISVAHACLGQVFFCIIVSLAILVRPGWNWDEPRLEDTSKPSARQLAVWTVGAIFLQVMLGAAFRHGGMGIGPHLAGAVVVTVVVVWLVKRILADYAHQTRLVRSSLVLGGLLVLQLVLGVGAYMEMIKYASYPQPEPPAITATTLHAAVGALVLAAALVMALEAYRGLSGSPAASKAELRVTT